MASAVVVWVRPTVQWLGQETTEEKLEKVEEKLSTADKILVASLFLNVVTLAWSVYQWKQDRRR